MKNRKGILKTQNGFWAETELDPRAQRMLGPTRSDSCGYVRPARRGLVACLHGPRASEAGPGAAPARLARPPVVRAQHVTVARPTASGYGTIHGKVFTMST
jgi:hypothetical protein